MQSHQDSDGFLVDDYCDSLLFTGLIGSAGVPVNITAAMDDVGEWHRRPISAGECYPGGASATISKDMMIGLLAYIWANHRLDLATDFYNYAESHALNMGQGDPSKTYMPPSMLATLCDIIYALGGEDHPIDRSIPQAYSTSDTGYEAHLDVLYILLRGAVNGSISGEEEDVLSAQYNRVAGNALFNYAYRHFNDGNYADAVNILLNEQYFPTDRLPKISDRGDLWMWQDDPNSWVPGSGDTEWSGGDLVHVAGLILGK